MQTTLDRTNLLRSQPEKYWNCLPVLDVQRWTHSVCVHSQGTKSSRALCDAMKAVQTTRQFSHPANWAGWVLIGSDVKLSSKVALMGHALSQLLRSPSKSREAMRVVLHLVSFAFLCRK